MIAPRLALPLAALAVAALAALPRADHDRGLRLSAARGALELVNSHNGEAAFAAPNMKPGDVAAGSVSVTNGGSSEARLFLRSYPPERSGALADVLTVRIGEGRATVARGTLSEVAGCHDLGLLAPGSRRTFRFSATWPAGTADNAYSGSTARADERWFANADGEGCRAGEAPVADSIESAPAARLVISHRRIRLVRGRAKLVVRCLGDAGAICGGTAYLRPRPNRTSRLGGAAAPARTRFRIHAGQQSAIYVAVPARSRAALRARRKAVALAVVGPAPDQSRLITLLRSAARSRQAAPGRG